MNYARFFNRYPSLLLSKLLMMCLLIGCSGNGVSTDQTSRVESKEVTEEISTNANEVLPDETVEQDDSGIQEDVMAIEPYRLEGIEVSLLDVRRASGGTLNVYWRMKNKSSSAQDLVTCSASWYCPYQLAAGNFGDGIYVIDSVNQRKHLVVKADKKPVVSTFKTPLSIGPGSSINLWAKFPAPPPDVKNISIYIPGVAPMEDIPISE